MCPANQSCFRAVQWFVCTCHTALVTGKSVVLLRYQQKYSRNIVTILQQKHRCPI